MLGLRQREDRIEAGYPPNRRLDLELVRPDEKMPLPCGGVFRYGRSFFHCWNRSGHGPLDVAGGLKNSCNVFFFQVGLRVGIDNLNKYSRVYGYGAPTGIPVPHENAGLIPDRERLERKWGKKWPRGEVVNNAIGQGQVLLTPIQELVAFSAFANGGRLYRPRLVTRAVDGDGVVQKSFPPEVHGVVVALALAARARWWERAFFVGANVLAGAATPLLWGLLKEYQRARIMSFLSPTADPHGAGYSVIQAKIALGSGRLFGKGFLEGSQVHCQFVPEGHTDFVLPAWGEEWGFVGCLLVFALFAVIVFRSFLIAYRAGDRRGGILAFGLGTLFFTQFVVNAAMAVGLIPVTGLPLPFMSYGGSATLASFVAVGLILNVKLRRERVAEQMRLLGY